MEAKNVLYAAVGAPVVAARRVGDRVEALRGKLSEERASYSEAASKALSDWAAEGEKLFSRISEGKVVEEISSKVDLDQAKEQVGKLRDQLEDMLDTWRHSFRPEKADEKAEQAPEEEAAAKDQTAEEAPAAEAAEKSAPTKTSAAETTQSSTAAKTSSAKSAKAPKAKTGS